MSNSGISVTGRLSRRTPKAFQVLVAEVLSAVKSERHKARTSRCFSSRTRMASLLMVIEQRRYAGLLGPSGQSLQRKAELLNHGVKLICRLRRSITARCGAFFLNLASASSTGRRNKLQLKTIHLGTSTTPKTRRSQSNANRQM